MGKEEPCKWDMRGNTVVAAPSLLICGSPICPFRAPLCPFGMTYVMVSEMPKRNF